MKGGVLTLGQGDAGLEATGRVRAVGGLHKWLIGDIVLPLEIPKVHIHK